MGDDQERVDLRNSLVTLGQGAIKAAMFVNGGSAIALLAFIGQIWPEQNDVGVVESAACAIAIFTGGVFLALISAVLAYFAQLFYYRSYTAELDTRIETNRAEVIRHAALGFVVLSVVVFVIGVCQSLSLLVNNAA